ncbi:unnamed protein product [Lathyrus oleraceus]
MASVQSNKDMEDHNQVDVSHDALFIGIYDGFKCHTAACYIRTHIFRTLLHELFLCFFLLSILTCILLSRNEKIDSVISVLVVLNFDEKILWLKIAERIELNDNHMTLRILREIVKDMENRFILFAERSFEQEYHKEDIGLVSSGCLICLIWRGILYLANIGNSRAVLGSIEANGVSKKLCMTQLVRHHSCENTDIRNEFHVMHPGDKIVCQFTEVRPVLNYHANKHPSWTFKGLIIKIEYWEVIIIK